MQATSSTNSRGQRKSFLQLTIWASWSYHLLAQTSFQLAPKTFWLAELLSQFFCYSNSSKNILCLLGKLKTEFTSPMANPLALGYRTLVSLHAVIAGSGTYELLTVPSFLCHKYISIHFRIIQLWEPFKENQLTRSVESWQNLVTKLRQLLLVSFNRHLGKFEDQVRALREKRTEPRWSFTTYFSLHVS